MAYVLDPRPLGDHLLVRELDPQEGKFPTGVQVMKLGPQGVEIGGHEPGTTMDPIPARGIVVAVGPGYAVAVEDERFKFVPMQVRTNDEVLFFSQHATQLRMPAKDLSDEGETLLLIREGQVLVILSSVEQPTEDDS